MNSKLNSIIKSLELFTWYNTKTLVLIFVLSALLALTQGVSFLMLIPLLQLLDLKGSVSTSPYMNLFSDMLKSLNVSLTLELLLISYVVILSVLYILQNRRAILQAGYQNRYAGFLRKDLYRRVIFSDWSILNKISKHNHVQLLTAEIPKATNFYFYFLNALTKLIVLVVFITMACLMSLKLTVIVGIVGILQFLLLYKYLRKSYVIGSGNRKTYKKVLKYIDDFWITIKPAKIHNTESFYYDNFAKADDQFVENQVEQIVNNEKPQLLYQMLALFNLVIMIYISVVVLSISIPSIIVLVLLFSKILPLFLNIYNDINQMSLNAESVLKLREMKFEEKKSEESMVEVVGDVLSNHIQMNNMSFEYSEQKQIFNDFSLQIKANLITGIFGESGRGKTTLIDLLSGLLRPTKGEIYFDNLVVNKQNYASIRNSIGYLPQESLFIDGSLRENLLWDTKAKVSDIQLEEVLEKVNAFDILKEKQLTLDSEILNYKYCFSGGELQRLALARVLLRNPKLLILDEATSALDEKNEDHIMTLLQDIKKSTTVIFVTHKKRLLRYFDEVVEL